MYGRIVFAYILTNIPISIYYVRRLFFVDQPFIEALTELIILGIEIISDMVIFGPMAWCCQVYHSPKKFIPKLQLMLRGHRCIPLKLKLDDLYNRLVRGPKMATTIGPMHPITYSSTVEVCMGICL